jgi:hypothetical protein
MFFDWSSFWFNVVEIPRHHPFYQELLKNRPGIPGKLHSIGGALLQLAANMWLIVATLCFALALRFRVWVIRNPNSRLRLEYWLAPFILCLLAIPTGLLGFAKVGGSVNSFAPFAYFALLAAGSLAVQLLPCLPRAAADTLQLGAVCLIGGVGLNAFQEANLARKAFLDLGNSQTAAAAQYLGEHPNSVYYPAQPLVHLCAEHRLYHFFYGVQDRELAGLTMTQARLKEGIPPNARIIAAKTHDRSLADFITEHFPEFQQSHQPVKNLPGWEIFLR